MGKFHKLINVKCQRDHIGVLLKVANFIINSYFFFESISFKLLKETKPPTKLELRKNSQIYITLLIGLLFPIWLPIITLITIQSIPMSRLILFLNEKYDYKNNFPSRMKLNLYSFLYGVLSLFVVLKLSVHSPLFDVENKLMKVYIYISFIFYTLICFFYSEYVKDYISQLNPPKNAKPRQTTAAAATGSSSTSSSSTVGELIADLIYKAEDFIDEKKTKFKNYMNEEVEVDDEQT